MTNKFSGEESSPPLGRSLSGLLFSAVLFQGKHWGLKASTSPCSVPSYPHCGLLLLLMQRKNCCPNCPHAFPWRRICVLLSRNQIALAPLSHTKLFFPFSLFPHWYMPGLAQSGNLIETSLLGFRRASPLASLLVLLHCWFPASRWRWVCCGVFTPCLCLLVCMRRHFSFSDLLSFSTSSCSPFSLLPAPLPQSEACWWLVIFLWTVQR